MSRLLLAVAAALASALVAGCGNPKGVIAPPSQPPPEDSSPVGDLSAPVVASQESNTPDADPTPSPTPGQTSQEDDPDADPPLPSSVELPPVVSVGSPVVPPVNGPPWLGFGGDAQHTGVAQIAAQTMARITWRRNVDLAPQYTEQGSLQAHYGSPVVSSRNTVMVSVKRGSTDGYDILALIGSNGETIWTLSSDYVMPPHRWLPSYNVTLGRNNRLYAPARGGHVLIRDNVDSPTGVQQSIAFYDEAAYNANKAAYDDNVFVDTPITTDSQGNIYFGFLVGASAPGGMQGGIARIAADGTGSMAAAASLTGDSAIDKAAMNSAPALSSDEKTLYIAVNGPNGKGYLVALDAGTLMLKNKVLLIDPQSKLPAKVSDDSTASPTVGPDGDVFFGVLETTNGQRQGRGWLLHFDASLSVSKTPGSFGWDNTVSIVPSSMVPHYSGSSRYLVASLYNNYTRTSISDAKHKVAILDPNTGQLDSISPAVTVMEEVMAVLGVTPDPSYPGGVIEWSSSKALVDTFRNVIYVGNLDGWLYCWDLTTNSLTMKVRLTSGLSEAYTPIALGADGMVYAISNAVLFAIGR